VLCTFGFVDHVMFSHNGQYMAHATQVTYCNALLPPPKKKVMFLVRSVCLFVCLSVGLLANL